MLWRLQLPVACAPLLLGRGELSPGLVVRVSVAASVRRRADPSSGNLTGVRVVPVEIGELDPTTRLDRIAAETAGQRARLLYQPGGAGGVPAAAGQLVW